MGKFFSGVAVTLGVLTVAVAYKVGVFDKLEEFVNDVVEEARSRLQEDEDFETEVVAEGDDL